VNWEFVQRLCTERGIGVPRIGIIYSGTPNAFSFGHTLGNARVVVTKGLLDVLTPEEVNAVLAHEIGHMEHWDFAVMAIAALAPLLLYQIYATPSHHVGDTRLTLWRLFITQNGNPQRSGAGALSVVASDRRAINGCLPQSISEATQRLAGCSFPA
jgi:Zn-dependent protease with chaperone function